MTRLLTLLLMPALIISGCSDRPSVEATRLAMNTIVKIEAVQDGSSEARPAIGRAFLRIEEIESLLNRYDPASELSAVNNLEAGREAQLSPEMARVIREAVRLHGATNGAFDITVSPLVELWKRHKEDMTAPDPGEISAALESVGSDRIEISESGAIRMTAPGVLLDLSAIAKGYAVDEARDVLKAAGVENALINAGGDIYCLGPGPRGGGWRVGVRHPRENRLTGVLDLTDKAVATSGDYENYFLIEEKRYSHLIDPRNGQPVSERPMSVTVVADDCLTADALATAIFVLGRDEGLRFAEDTPGVEAIVVSASGGEVRIEMTEGMKALYEAR
jgi:thiamine biosynthesis lipoprotein